jgi:hypothetical protein
MSNEIKSLTQSKEKSPALWTMFQDASGGLSYTRISGFIVLSVFFAVWGYLSIQTGVMVIPPQEMVYILVAFAAAKPIQRFAESKEIESQLNYDFQIAQIENNLVDNTPKL